MAKKNVGSGENRDAGARERRERARGSGFGGRRQLKLEFLWLDMISPFEQSRKMPDIGKPQLIPYFLYGMFVRGQQLARLLQSRILEVLVNADAKDLPERLFELRLTHQDTAGKIGNSRRRRKITYQQRAGFKHPRYKSGVAILIGSGGSFIQLLHEQEDQL